MPEMISPDGENPVLEKVVENVKFGGSFDKLSGVPQGAPTSCSVATLCLRDIERRMESVLYADDGVYSPETSSDTEVLKIEDPEKGVKLNPNKWK